jgi:membrane protein DedA with SNARE-associated domain
VLDVVGYPALVLLMLASPPIPSEAILPLAGFFSGTGQLVFPIALAAATLGAVGNAFIVYTLARWGGRPLLVGNRFLRLEPRRLDQIEHWFSRYGTRVVVFGRMLSVVRWLVGIPAGAGRMPIRRYLPLTALGCLGWNSLLMSFGLVLGRNHDQVGHAVIAASAVLLACCCSVAIAIALRRRRRRQHEGNVVNARSVPSPYR